MGKRKSKQKKPARIEYDVCGFNFDTVIEYSKTLKTLSEQVIYLEYVLKEKKNNPTEIDLDLYTNGPTFEEKIKNEIEFLKTQLEVEEPSGFREKIIWMKNRQDFAALFDILIANGFISYKKDKYVSLCKHFNWIDEEMTPEQLKHLRNNIKNKSEVYQLSDEMKSTLEKLQNKS